MLTGIVAPIWSSVIAMFMAFTRIIDTLYIRLYKYEYKQIVL